MRSEDQERTTEVTVNELEKLSGLLGGGRRMWSTSMLANYARFAF
jgi:hypothetical protein